jgi:transposase
LAGQVGPHQRFLLAQPLAHLASLDELLARRGKTKAIVALGHTILTLAYHLLTRTTDDQELGARYFDERDQPRVTRRLVHRLEALGYTVPLDRPAAGRRRPPAAGQAFHRKTG